MRRNLISVLILILAFGISTLKGLALPGEEIYERNKRAALGIVTTFVYEQGGVIGTYSVSGSGVFIKRGGYALVANHCLNLNGFVPGNPNVLSTTTEIAVIQPNGGRRIFQARVIGINAPVDLAVIQVLGIKDSEYEVAEIGNSDALRPGELVYGIGCPTGQDLFGSIWSTRVQFVNRQFGSSQVTYMIQLDYPGIPVASGSPIINTAGKVVGIVLMNFNDKMSFAKPVNLARLSLLTKGDVFLPEIGIDVVKNDPPKYSSTSEFVEKDLTTLIPLLPGLPEEKLRKIATASTRSSAIVWQINKEELKKRFAVGDIILKVNSKRIREGMALKAYLLGRKAGTSVTLTVLHPDTGKITKEKVTLSDK